jgi:hypothetical protein
MKNSQKHTAKIEEKTNLHVSIGRLACQKNEKNSALIAPAREKMDPFLTVFEQKSEKVTVFPISFIKKVLIFLI